MKNALKNTVKFAAGVCVALGAVAVTTYTVTGSAAVKVVSAGVKAAKGAMKEEMEALKTEAAPAAEGSSSVSAEETAMFADVQETATETAEN